VTSSVCGSIARTPRFSIPCISPAFSFAAFLIGYMIEAYSAACFGSRMRRIENTKSSAVTFCPSDH
jgi:hypothetical protein